MKKNVLSLIIVIFNLTCATGGMQNIPEIDPNTIINGTKVGNGSGTDENDINTGFALITSDRGDCTGIVYTNIYVLTAKHCITYESGNPVPISTIKVSMGTQLINAVEVKMHPSLDVAVIKLKSPIKVKKSNMCYKKPIYNGTYSSLLSKNVTCYGFGNNTYESGSGILRKGDFIFKSTTTGHLGITLNSSSQITWVGDSGGTCLYNDYITGISERCVVTNPLEQNNYCKLVSPELFRDWVRKNTTLDMGCIVFLSTMHLD